MSVLGELKSLIYQKYYAALISPLPRTGSFRDFFDHLIVPSAAEKNQTAYFKSIYMLKLVRHIIDT